MVKFEQIIRNVQCVNVVFLEGLPQLDWSICTVCYVYNAQFTVFHKRVLYFVSDVFTHLPGCQSGHFYLCQLSGVRLVTGIFPRDICGNFHVTLGLHLR